MGAIHHHNTIGKDKGVLKEITLVQGYFHQFGLTHSTVNCSLLACNSREMKNTSQKTTHTQTTYVRATLLNGRTTITFILTLYFAELLHFSMMKRSETRITAASMTTLPGIDTFSIMAV